MIDEPKAVREIHEIREQLYEQEKDWTTQERVEHYNQIGDKYAKKLGLRIAPTPGEEPAKKTG